MPKAKKTSNGDGEPQPSVEERAYQYLRREILDGNFRPGDRLREEAVASQIGLSRTPVRGAIHRLSTEGLVEFQRYVGAFVRVLPKEEVDQIFQFRAVVESLASELAAQNATPEEIETLAAISRKMDILGAKELPDLSQLARLNRDFHTTLLSASRNVFVIQVAENLGNLNFMIRSYSHYTRPLLLQSLGHHRELVQALRARNSAWARSVMTAHIESSRFINRTVSSEDPAAA